LRLRKHLAEGDDAAVIAAALVLPDRYAVATVKVSAAREPPVLIQVTDRIDDRL
jgi:hypothetical protein